MRALLRPPFWGVGVTPRFDHRDASLVLYLPLWYQYSDMTGSTIYSYDRNHHTGTVTGASWTSKGRSIDGVDDKISIPDASVLDLTDALTIAGWVKPGTQTAAYAALVSKQDNTGAVGTGYTIDRNNTDASSYRFVFGYLAGGANWQAAANLIVLTNDIWQHFAVTKTGTTIAIHVNGALVTSETVAQSTIVANTANLQIGDWPDSGATRRYWTGTVGEILVYNRALTLGEIRRIYQATKWRY